jgi:hypothetical protein
MRTLKPMDTEYECYGLARGREASTKSSAQTHIVLDSRALFEVILYSVLDSLSNADSSIVWTTNRPNSGLLDMDTKAAETTNLRCIAARLIKFAASASGKHCSQAT